MPFGFSHVSIVVPDLEAAARALADKYGLVAGERHINEQQGVHLAYIELGSAKIELMQPSRPDSPVAKFLVRNPRGGIHHVCLSVDDVAVASRDLAAKGVRMLGPEPQRNVVGEPIAFIHPADFFGALVELEERR
jgi:methylmalonyl-CoA/ethylmalonyl-CoA epimerase